MTAMNSSLSVDRALGVGLRVARRLALAIAGAEPLRIDISPRFDRHDHLSPKLANWIIAPEAPAKFEQDGVELAVRIDR